MKVRFENCEVDVWRVRKGTVVGSEWGLGFVEAISKVYEDGTMKILVDGNEQYNNFTSDKLTWLEPH